MRPEQLTLRNGRDAARAEIVDGARHQFLAGAGFSQDQHGGVGARGLRDQLVNHDHGGAAAHQAGLRELQIRFGGGNGVGFAARLQQAPQQIHHGGDIEGLADEIAGAAGHRFHGHLQRTLRGHQHDGQVRV